MTFIHIKKKAILIKYGNLLIYSMWRFSRIIISKH